MEKRGAHELDPSRCTDWRKARALQVVRRRKRNDNISALLRRKGGMQPLLLLSEGCKVASESTTHRARLDT